MQPIINRQTLDDSTLDQWVEEFLYIYGNRDKDLTLEQMWMKAVEDSAKVGEGVRENKGHEVVDYLSKTFCWTLSFIGRLLRDEKIDYQFKISQACFLGYTIDSLAKLVFFKYPTICPRCLKKNCMCPVFPDDILLNINEQQRQNKLKIYRQRLSQMPKTMADFAQMFADIYDTAHFIKSIDDICFHFLEEVGEVARAIRKLQRLPAEHLSGAKRTSELLIRRQNLAEELADVISWTYSLARKKRAELEDFTQFVTIGSNRLDSLSLQRMLWKTYGDKKRNQLRCPICKKRPCLSTCEKK